MDFLNNGLGIIVCTLPFISSVSSDFKMHETESASPFQCNSWESVSENVNAHFQQD